MKQNIYFLLLFTLIACKDSGDFDLAYPLFEVAKVTVNSTERITVEVTFSHVGSDEILRHGFVWDWVRIPTLGTFPAASTGRGSVFIEGTPDFNGFSETIESTFQRTQGHTIRAFVVTSTDTIYSTTRSFIPNP